MRAMRQPTRFTLEKATELGRMMAVNEPRIIPNLSEAHEYVGYIDFLQAHRHTLEQHAAFGPWDARLNSMIEIEGKMLGFVLSDRDEWDELLVSIAGPIRCAFWYGWETAHGMKRKFDEHSQDAHAQEHQMQVIRVRDTIEAPMITRTAVTQESDAFWDNVASTMLSSLESSGAQAPPSPRAPGTSGR